MKSNMSKPVIKSKTKNKKIISVALVANFEQFTVHLEKTG